MRSIIYTIFERNYNLLNHVRLTGSVQKCYNEGESVHVSINEDPCIKCKCENKEVVCNIKSCPKLKNCYLHCDLQADQASHGVSVSANKTCCNDICRGCFFEGTYYESGLTWTHKTNPCRHFICGVS